MTLIQKSQDGRLVEWSVHTPNLTKEILEGYPGKAGAIFTQPLNIFRSLLAQVGERAAELNDPVLNALMCRLTIYGVADPEDKENYDRKKLNEVLTHPDYIEWRKTH